MTKRILSIILVIGTLLTLCVPALAAEDQEEAFVAIEEPAVPDSIEAEAPAEPEAPEAPEAPVEPAEALPQEELPAEPAEADAPQTVADTSGTCGAGLTWRLSGSTLTISGSGAMNSYSFFAWRMAPWYDARDQVRSVVINEGVTGIGDEAFFNCTKLTSVSLPGTLTAIGERAFQDCESLGSVTIPASVTSIGEVAFSRCINLTSATVNARLSSIPSRMFAGCAKLRTVSIPEGVTLIETAAFDSCAALQSITFPSTLTRINGGAFRGCSSLRSVTFPASLDRLCEHAFADCTSLADVRFLGASHTEENNVFSNTPWLKNQGSFVIVNGQLREYQGPGGSVTIPSSVTSIGDHAFTGRTDVTAVTIPSTVRTIGEWAFGESGLRSVTIPSGVTSISAWAFGNCQYLASVIIASSVRTIGDGAFYGCQAITSVTIPEGVRTIGKEAFRDCAKLTSITVPSTVTAIGDYAFCSYALRKIVINGATFSYGRGYDGAQPLSVATVYSNGTGTARSYAMALGAHYEDISRQHRNGWADQGGEIWYYYTNGELTADKWVYSSGHWYFFDPSGVMYVGLKQIVTPDVVGDGTTGEMGGGVKDDDGWYYFSEKHDGSFGHVVANGWKQINGKWYYFNTKHDGTYGRALTGWQWIDRNWFYFSPETGQMLTGLQTIIDLSDPNNTGVTYYLNEKHNGTYGKMTKGWQWVNGDWYYFDPSGAMVTNDWVQDGNVWYFLTPEGKMMEGFNKIDLGRSDDGWYYFSPNHDGTYGHVLSGWQTINGYHYYFDPAHNGTFGRAYTGTHTINGRSYTFDSQGRCTNYN